MKRRVWLLGVGALILALRLPGTNAEGSGFSNTSLVGDYFCIDTLLFPNGQFVNGDLETGQAGLILVQHFDGHGNFSETFSDYNVVRAAFGGPSLCTWTGGGTYTVNADGTGNWSDTDTSTISGCESPITGQSPFIVERNGAQYEFLDLAPTGAGTCLRSD